MRELLKDRNLRLLLVGQTLSMFGDTAMLLVLAMWAKQLTGSNSAAGTVLAAVIVPTLLAPLGGIVIDRLPRRPLMIAVDVATAAVVLTLLLVHDEGDLWLLYVVGFLYGASLVLFQSARAALLTTMLPEQLLGPANGSLGTVREALRLVGPLTGAALFAGFGGHAVAVLDAATFLVSALALALMRVAEPKPEPHEHHVLHEATAGARHLFTHPVLRALVVATVICMLAIGFGESVFFAVVDQGLGRPVSFIGVLAAVQGAGAVLGGIAVTVLISRVGELRLVPVGLALIGVGCLLPVSDLLPVVAAGSFLLGAGLPIVVVAIVTALQRRTPGPVQGRVFTAFEFLTGGPQLVSILVGAALVAVVDYRWLLLFMAVGNLLGALYAAVRLREPVPGLRVGPGTAEVEPTHPQPLA
ncbi:MFS transporter [Angustibacter luteus]|uniref:MFS transporter n=1 Tax=Angustibacter luteus TaxID=658456 RepID=A0ABW1JBF1_9ACTN